MAYRSIASTATPAHPLVIAAPAGIVDGDILVLWVVVDNQNAITYTPPAGFTALTGFPLSLNNGGGTDGGGMYVAYKKASSESGTYSTSNNLTEAMNGGIVCVSARDAAGFLHRSSIGTNNTANNSPWNITSAAFGTVTAGLCDVVFIGWSDNKTTGAVTHAGPAGHTKRADVNSGFYNSFCSTQDAVASGATGALTGTGTQASQQAGWACACIALLDDGGGGGGATPVSASHYSRMNNEWMEAA